MQEALDFQAESNAIAALLETLSPEDFQTVTQFKDWTIYDILAHLHLWNLGALWTLQTPEKFKELMVQAMTVFQGGQTHQDLHRGWAAKEGFETGDKLFTAWKDGAAELTEAFLKADPEQRVNWAALDMTTRSCIIARQMEAWAHAQAIFDVLGETRKDGSRLKNVAHIGVTTFSWSFRVRGVTPPTPKPFVKLTAPSGAIWTWNDKQSDNCVEGSAEEFSQVVTQCRNVKDTDLTMTGPIAEDWMAHAQCFAGGAETPPPQGARRKG
mgnify:CR=1 FL=1